jgi:hypothetical protein
MAERNTPSAFDAAFAELDAALIDLDGDGRPDVAVPQKPRNALLRGVPDYGFGPVTPMSREGYMPQGEMRSYEPRSQVNALLDYGSMPARGLVEQFDRAGTAVADAYNDPSLANVTNAGAQTALAVGRPVAAGGILAAGMMEGARRDFAPDIFSPANALTRKQTREQEMRDREAARQREAEANRIRLESEARRGEADAAAVREAEAQKKQLELQKQQAQKDEWDRAVGRSEDAFQREMGRVRRFSDSKSYTKDISDKVGGLAPFIGGLVGGKVARMAGRGTAGQVIAGGAGGIAATSAPLFEDAYFTDIDNPERAAYMARGAELPPGHPRKQEFIDYGRSLPEENPVRTHATESLYNPVRLGLSAAEGGLAGMLGGDTANALLRPFRRGNALNRSTQTPPGYGAPRSTYNAPEIPPRPQPRPIVGKDGRTRFHDPDTGDFTSAPER